MLFCRISSIREAQRLDLADVVNETKLMFIQAYDLRIPGLHPEMKLEHRRIEEAKRRLEVLEGIKRLGRPMEKPSCAKAAHRDIFIESLLAADVVQPRRGNALRGDCQLAPRQFSVPTLLRLLRF